MMGMRRWRMVLAIGAIVFASSLGLPLTMEGIIYDTPSDVSYAPSGSLVTFVGAVKKVGLEKYSFGDFQYLEVEGLNGRIICRNNDFRVGEKVLVKGKIVRQSDGQCEVVGYIPGVVVFDSPLRAEVSRPWWPMVSEMMMIAGIAIIPTGLAGMSFSRWKRGLPSLPNPHKEPGSS